MKKLITGIALICAVQFSSAQNSEFKKDVLEYIKITKVSEQQKSMLREQLSQMVKGDKLDKILAEADKELPKLRDLVADEIMEVFTHEEIKEMNKFYRTDLGKTIIEKGQTLQPKLVKAGMEWGQKDLTPIIMKYMAN